MVGNYPVITLCGSTRFKDAFIEAQRRLTLEGYIVISVGLFGHSGDGEVWENMPEGTVTRTKAMLDDMHKRKIDMADEIYVLNVNDYIGQSTRSEIAYARAHGKIVRFLEPHVEDMEPEVQRSGSNAYGAGMEARSTESAYADSVPAAQRSWEDVYEAGGTWPRPAESAYADSVPAAYRSGEDAYEVGDDYAALEAIMRQAVQGVGVAGAGVYSPDDATARMIAYQNDDDAEALAQEQAQQAAGTSDVDPARQAVQAAGIDAVGAQEPHASYTVHLSPDEEEQDPAQAKAYYALQMLQDGYDVGNTAYFIGEDEAFVRAVMVQYGITDEDLIRFQQH